MIDINELRAAVEAAGLNAISRDEVLELLDRLEVVEQERDWHAERCEDAMNECDALRAYQLDVTRAHGEHRVCRTGGIEMINHAKELRRFAPVLGKPTIMLDAADEIERLAAKLEAAEKSDVESLAMYSKARDERDALRVKIEQMERQEPVGTTGGMPGTIGFTMACFHADKVPIGSKLYALPGAKGEDK